jgi:hypothetical protein
MPETTPPTGIPATITNQLNVELTVFNSFTTTSAVGSSSTNAEDYQTVYTQIGTVPANGELSFTTPDALCQLVIAEASNNFPVQEFVPPAGATSAATTVTQADLDECQQVYNFYLQFVSQPYSPAAIRFQEIFMTTTDMTKLESEVQTFFTDINMPGCTYGDWVIVCYWATNELDAWDGSYYCYETAATDSGSFGLVLPTQPSAMLTITNGVPEYQPTASGAVGSSDLTFINSLLSSPGATATSGLLLTAIPRSLAWEGQPSQIVMCFAGTYNGQQMIAQPYQNPSLPWWVGAYDLADVAFKVVKLAMLLKMSAHLLKAGGKGLAALKKKFGNEKDTATGKAEEDKAVADEAADDLADDDGETITIDVDVDNDTVEVTDNVVDTDTDTDTDTVTDTDTDTDTDTVDVTDNDTDTDTDVDVDVDIDVDVDVFAIVDVDVDVDVDIDTDIDTVDVTDTDTDTDTDTVDVTDSDTVDVTDTVTDTDTDTDIDVDTEIEKKAEVKPGMLKNALNKLGGWLMTKGFVTLAKALGQMGAFIAIQEGLKAWQTDAEDITDVTPQDCTGLALLINYMLNPAITANESWTTFADLVQQTEMSIADQQELLNAIVTAASPTENTAASNWVWSQGSEQTLECMMMQFHTAQTYYGAYLVLANYTCNGIALPVIVGCNTALSALTQTASYPASNLYIQAYTQATGWGTPLSLSQSIASTGGLALALFKGKLYMAFTGPGQILNLWSSADGTTWQNQTVLPCLSNNAPALIEFKNQLYLAYTGTDNSLYICSSKDGVTFSQAVTWGNNTSACGPALAVYDNLLYMAFTGMDSNSSVNLGSSSDGETFSNQMVLTYSSVTAGAVPAAPSLATFNGQLYLAFSSISSSTNGYAICLCSSSNGASFGNLNILTGQPESNSLNLTAHGNQTLYVSYVGSGLLTLWSSPDGINFTTTTLGQGGQAALGGIGESAYIAFTQTSTQTQS